MPQTSQTVFPASSENLPDGQAAQVGIPAAAEKLPGTQSVHQQACAPVCHAHH